jgi:hypothetical protein
MEVKCGVSFKAFLCWRKYNSNLPRLTVNDRKIKAPGINPGAQFKVLK